MTMKLSDFEDSAGEALRQMDTLTARLSELQVRINGPRPEESAGVSGEKQGYAGLEANVGAFFTEMFEAIHQASATVSTIEESFSMQSAKGALVEEPRSVVMGGPEQYLGRAPQSKEEEQRRQKIRDMGL